MHREVNQCADALATLGANLGCVWHWTKSFHFQLNKLFSNGLLDFSFILFNNPLFVRDRAPSPFLVLGQTHVYGWNRVIISVDPTFCTPYDSSPYSLMMLKL